MTDDGRDATAAALHAALEAVEPRDPRPLRTLIDRLIAEGHLRGARIRGRAAAPIDLAEVPVHGVTDDSRRAGGGAIFVAIPGEHVDGHDYAAAALRAGAGALIVDHPLPDVDLPQLVVERSQVALATAAAWWYGDPSRELGVVGITGTDGKTTTSFLAVAALEAAGLRSGLIGTVETRVGAIRDRHTEHVTTPSAPALHRTIRAMQAAGDAVAVVESTSHGLALERVGGVAYDVAILTNVTHEHLEFHGTWEAYRDAKLSLFERLASGPRNPRKTLGGRDWPKVGIVNRDDPSASLFEAVTREAGARVLTYGTDADADVRATRVEEDARRLRVAFAAPSGDGRLELRLAGRFNVHNALAVVALGEALGLSPEAVRRGLESVPGVPGRMERIDAGQPFGVVVDYAHSPASLETVLGILAPIAAARGGGLIAVFGSAGERDTAKRPLMGRIAGDACRLVVVTDEDPRGEDRDTINDAIAAGAEQAGKRRDADLLVIADRRAAIEAAFERARPADIVLLAGKGHERSILYADGPVPWDETAEARRLLAAMGYLEAVG
jgi:UDP-N-acetylmuramoyl-L-alanyl-D-glutamate--2,6-diaminopimelate ligase